MQRQKHAKYNPYLGIITIDRHLTMATKKSTAKKATCAHATAFCRKSCYAWRQLTQYPQMLAFQRRLAAWWRAMTPESVKAELASFRHPTKRVRICSSGEPFATQSDFGRVAAIVRGNRDATFWIPTRAWRSARFLPQLAELNQAPNARIVASMDPSNDKQDWQTVKDANLSTMTFLENGETPKFTPLGEKFFYCPKTWEHKHGHCARCRKGCFSAKRVNVLLKKH